jgi:hypothetical protein
VPRGSGDPHELLARGGPREILARIVPGDPLGLRARVARRARERALLVDVERAALRAIALVAARGPRYRGRPRLDLWLEARIDDALDDLLEEDRTPGAARHGSAADLARRLGLSPAALARGRARFHDLPFDERDAFVRLVIEVDPVEEAARSLGAPGPELARRARRGLVAFLGGEVRP